MNTQCSHSLSETIIQEWNEVILFTGLLVATRKDANLREHFRHAMDTFAMTNGVEVLDATEAARRLNVEDDAIPALCSVFALVGDEATPDEWWVHGTSIERLSTTLEAVRTGLAEDANPFASEVS
jgi:hypothetical protein